MSLSIKLESKFCGFMFQKRGVYFEIFERRRSRSKSYYASEYFILQRKKLRRR